MALIPKEDFAILKSASEVKSVSDSAPLEAEKAAIAKLVNTAANTGQYEVLYNHDISDEMMDVLKGMSYTITRRPLPEKNTPNPFQFIISWK